MITTEKIKMIDKSDMFSILKDFHLQVEDAVNIGMNADYNRPDTLKIRNIIINGLGGSAIGGDLVRSYISYEIDKPVYINRTYNLPAFADGNTLAVISSYSGDTEETTSVYFEAIKKGCRILCITSGGTVAKTAKENGHTLIIVKKGYQPRCALGYSFFGLLTAFIKMKLIKTRDKDISETIEKIKNKSTEYSEINNSKNPAIEFAQKLKGTLPIVYSSSDVLDVVNLRWRGQISENAKILAYGNLYPEMNHNELVGWKINEDIMKKISVIFLKDADDNERVKLRMKITEETYRKYAHQIININSDGGSKLERIFDLIYLGDWISYYLALLNETDPTPVDVIKDLKEKLTEF
jgi:glucose/mannose-6-phosphate isomerase